MKLKLRYKGGKGSGFKGHAGRLGHVGGSSSGGGGKGSWIDKVHSTLPKGYKSSVKVTTIHSGMSNFVTSNTDEIILNSDDLDTFFENELARNPNSYHSVMPYTEQDKARDAAIEEARAKKRAKFNAAVMNRKW
jgi:hypothetical protein